MGEEKRGLKRKKEKGKRTRKRNEWEIEGEL